MSSKRKHALDCNPSKKSKKSYVPSFEEVLKRLASIKILITGQYEETKGTRIYTEARIDNFILKANSYYKFGTPGFIYQIKFFQLQRQSSNIIVDLFCTPYLDPYTYIKSGTPLNKEYVEIALPHKEKQYCLIEFEEMKIDVEEISRPIEECDIKLCQIVTKKVPTPMQEDKTDTTSSIQASSPKESIHEEPEMKEKLKTYQGEIKKYMKNIQDLKEELKNMNDIKEKDENEKKSLLQQLNAKIKEANGNNELKVQMNELNAIKEKDENEKKVIYHQLNEAKAEKEKCLVQRQELEAKLNGHYQKLNQMNMEFEDRISQRSNGLYKLKEDFNKKIDSLM